MKIGVVGTGNVGATVAFLLATTRIADELILVDRTHERALAESHDISHALPMISDCLVRNGEYSDLSGADIVVTTCGVKRGESGKDRLALLSDNIHLYTEAVRQIVDVVPETIIIVVTNPVDVLSMVTLQISGLEKRQIIGSGTILDSARFMTILSRYFNVAVSEVKADIFGEHGNSQVPIWSAMRICNRPLHDFVREKFPKFADMEKSAIATATKFAADEIINGKQATYYGIAGAVANICRAIKSDSQAILNVSTFHENFEGIDGVFLSTPATIGKHGITKILPLQIDESERNELIKSAHIIREHTEYALKILQK
jgi:L-lactate dehydrogenase